MLPILLDNAFKYTPPPGQVHIGARVDDGHAEISVTDTGIGIPPEDDRRIFERYRGRNTAATGTGLGLAIASWVISQHAGDITVTSTPSVGSRLSTDPGVTRRGLRRHRAGRRHQQPGVSPDAAMLPWT